MSEFQTTRLSLSTGVTLKVALAGEGEPIVFLHGFPESHRTWRHQLHALSPEFRAIAPDQRGFGGSDKPKSVHDYATSRIVDDVFALADALEIDRFTLVGHDWGGVAAWAAALKHSERVQRLVIVNAPHPLIFQRSLIEDEAQREVSQYIRAFRKRGFETLVKIGGYGRFFDAVFGANADTRMISEAEREAYIADWKQPGALTAMLNWYRASEVKVPKPGEKAHLPLWCHLPFPAVHQPVLVVWGLKDKALLPVQLEGLDEVATDLRIVTDETGGHFLPWERPDVVTSAIREFLRET